VPLVTINYDRVSSERIFRASACAAGGKKRERTRPPPPCVVGVYAAVRARLTSAVVNCGNLERPVALARASAVFIPFLSPRPSPLARARARRLFACQPASPVTRPPSLCTRAYKCSLFGRSRFLEMRLAMPVTGSYIMVGGAGRAIGFLRNGRWG